MQFYDFSLPNIYENQKKNLTRPKISLKKEVSEYNILSFVRLHASKASYTVLLIFLISSNFHRNIPIKQMD